MLETLLMTNSMGKDLTDASMENNMKVSTEIIRGMVRVYAHTLMELSLQENLKMGKEVEKEFRNGRMELNMRVLS